MPENKCLLYIETVRKAFCELLSNPNIEFMGLRATTKTRNDPSESCSVGWECAPETSRGVQFDGYQRSHKALASGPRFLLVNARSGGYHRSHKALAGGPRFLPMNVRPMESLQRNVAIRSSLPVASTDVVHDRRCDGPSREGNVVKTSKPYFTLLRVSQPTKHPRHFVCRDFGPRAPQTQFLLFGASSVAARSQAQVPAIASPNAFTRRLPISMAAPEEDN